MGERTNYPPGTFSWVDLATTDPAGAQEFYGRLFGWQSVDTPYGEGITYTMFLLDGKAVAACYRHTPEQRAQSMLPAWLSYVTVVSADESAARARELGGTTVAEPYDVGDTGRMGFIRDPQGALFAIWEPRSIAGAERVNDPGCLTWNELRTSDPHAALDFYTRLFGWDAQEFDTGTGIYVTVSAGGRSNGGIMSPPQGVEASPHWAPFFTVEGCDKAVALVEELGGVVPLPPMDVPTGRIAWVADAQGAGFGLFQGEIDD